ncbi:amino acid adenylation domain-containing protein [Actinosynnema sp. NPDC020468]|uniref:amino acid adenylation domain-containing protein n=1 Tax=Actinosynnema sp. NPDC020468 TaxID=3154488 RepID=UPI0033DEC08D
MTRLLPDLFADVVARTPDAVAVVDDHKSLTYQELDVASGRVAAGLLAAGHGPGTVVGVRMRRAVDLPVALWGIWKAGAAYVPLDPDHPEERVARIKAESGCVEVLTSELVARFVAGHEPVPAVPVVADSLAYVLYTSGSTGRPKGAMLSHGNVTNRVLTTVADRDLGPEDRWLQKSALPFDASVTELFSPPVSGGVLIMAPDGAERDARTMLEAVIRHRATVLQTVPSVLRLLVAEPLLRECTTLRWMSTGGELLHAELCHRVWDLLPDVVLWNTYGPTECCVDQTQLLCDPALTTGPVPIGRPLDGCHILVVDEFGELVPLGVPGELCVGGVQVGWGYGAHSALTAEKYVPNPYGEPGSRMYRTGDRVRWRDDGVLEWLGRLDGQIKVNGVRIEPAEVETALLGHPEVKAGAVVAVPSGEDKRLVAFVVTRTEVAPGELRSFLRDRLPDYLVPTLFVPLDDLPVTLGGKPDRSALRALDLSEHTATHGWLAPATPEERTVARVWADLLDVADVGAEDDFFQRGGHSLLITRLAERLRAATGRDVGLRDLFSATTVRAQAALVAAAAPMASAPERPAARPDRLPLSHGQQRLWFLEQLRRGDQEYVVPVFLTVPADVHTDTVRKALDALAERHEVLRTRYPSHDSEPYQEIDAPAPVGFRAVEQHPDHAVEVFAGEIARGFDLEHGPVWRALLVRRPGEAGRLLITLHHIACDGRSVVVLSDEFRRLCAGEELPAPSGQYADHALRQRGARTEVLDAQSAHWREELAGVPALELPTDRPRATERDSRGAALDFTLTPAEAEALVAFGRAHGATPFMTLLTVFDVLLARYSGSWDFAVGTPVSGRDRDADDVVGFFLNSLPLRNRVRPHRTFTEALADTRAACAAAFGNADIAFERLVEELGTDRDLSRTPVFQVIFDLHEGGVAATNAESDALLGEIWRTAKTDLTLIARRHPDGGVQGILEYATALFDEGTIRRLGANFATLAAALVAAPDVPVAAVALVAPDELDLLVRRWNDTADALPAAPVHRMISEWAAEVPGATALVSAGMPTTFEELEVRANKFAHVLLAAGAGPETVVGVLLERGVDLVACLLGVWKAGAAYVPLDPSFPADRVELVLADSAAAVVVTDSTLERSVGGFAGRRLVVDRDAAEIARASFLPPDVEDDLDRLAYVIYTSGSTGRPKGVAAHHLGLANYLLWTIEAYASRGAGGAPLFSSLAFDLALPNLFTPLLTGQPVHLLDHDLDLAKLGRALVEAAPFSFIKAAPAQLELVLHQLEGEPPTPLAAVVSAAGDWVPASLAQRWRTATGQPDTRFTGEYGPTEITVGNSLFDADTPWEGEYLSIGTPIPNTTMLVLDEFLRPAPIGVVGEIHVGGVGVARGYTGNPVLTAEKFVPDPFGPPGSRLYRTGDLGRVTATGDVEFRGRADNQVKIRGFRVELGEVEAALLAHPEVREAVLVHDTAAGRLIGYHVGDPDPAQLRAFLAARMPAHQVPDALVPLDAFPLTANGKVDRKALPDPGTPAEAQVEDAVTPLQEQLLAIWSRVLGEQVRPHDNFFALGGHSLVAAKLASLIRRELGYDIGVRALFDRPTVAGLAALIEDAERPPGEPTTTTGPIEGRLA